MCLPPFFFFSLSLSVDTPVHWKENGGSVRHVCDGDAHSEEHHLPQSQAPDVCSAQVRWSWPLGQVLAEAAGETDDGSRLCCVAILLRLVKGQIHMGTFSLLFCVGTLLQLVKGQIDMGRFSLLFCGGTLLRLLKGQIGVGKFSLFPALIL